MYLRSARLIIATLACLLPAWAATANLPPEVVAVAEAQTVRAGGSAREVSLQGLFRDPDVTGTVVRMKVRLGTATKPVDIALYDSEKPITVENFLRYVRDGRYTGSFFHRSMPGFVVQGGGFQWNTTDQLATVDTYPTIQNEPGISNLRGTIAMAKLGGDPNSASSQWFINLANNSANLDAQNGGFTVFGRVVGNGMAVMDEVAALPRYNASSIHSAFTDLPLKDLTGNQLQRVFTVETTPEEVPALSYTAVSSNSDVISVTVANRTTLTLTPGSAASGTAQVTIRATDLDGGFTESSFAVKLLARSAGWSTAGDGQNMAFDPSVESGLPGDAMPVAVDRVAVTEDTVRTFTIRNDGSTLMEGLALAVTGAQAGDFVITQQPASSVEPGGTTTFTVRYAPGAAGDRAATLRVSTGDGDHPSFDILLSATAYDIAPPVIQGVALQRLTVNSQGEAEVPELRETLVTATDEEELTSFTQSPEAGTHLGIGSYPLVFTATDVRGLVTTAQTTLTVQYPRPSVRQVVPTSSYAGAPAPQQGLPVGSTLTAFGTPAISDLQQLASRVTIKAGNAKLTGILREDGEGENVLVAMQNGPSGVSGAVFKSFYDPLLSEGGKIVFIAKLFGVKATQDDGVWTDLFGSLSPVLREGEAIPGLGGLRLKSVTNLSFSDDGLLALVKLARAPGVVTAANDTALVRITGADSGALLARTGAIFDGSIVKQLQVLQAAVRSPGQGRWQGATGTVVKFTLQDRRTALVRIDAAGTQTRVLQAGADDPGLSTRLSALGVPSIAGDAVAVLATKAPKPGINAANDTAIWVATVGEPIVEVASENADTGLPGGAKFASFSDPVINDQGTVLFYSTLKGGAGTAANLPALWRKQGTSAPAVVARVGTPAVDENGALLVDANWSNITSFSLPDGAGAGAVFVAQLAGKAVKATSKLGLWAVDSTGVTRLVLRTGWHVTLPTGEKTVASFTLLNSLPGSLGARRSYNASGALAVQATFTDRTQAILRVDVP